jgi:hypothetical protein
MLLYLQVFLATLTLFASQASCLVSATELSFDVWVVSYSAFLRSLFCYLGTSSLLPLCRSSTLAIFLCEISTSSVIFAIVSLHVQRSTSAHAYAPMTPQIFRLAGVPSRRWVLSTLLAGGIYFSGT